MASSNRSSYDPDPRFYTWVHGLTDSQRQSVDKLINSLLELNSLQSLYNESASGNLLSISDLDADLRAKAEGYLDSLRDIQKGRNAAKIQEA